VRRPHGQAVVDPDCPEQFALCDRCARQFNRSALIWQKQWGGPSLITTNLLVCERCLDDPAPFQRTIVLPMDPPPVYNARHEGNMLIDAANFFTARPLIDISGVVTVSLTQSRSTTFMLGGEPLGFLPLAGAETASA
jgi:hypothetical protein